MRVPFRSATVLAVYLIAHLVVVRPADAQTFSNSSLIIINDNQAASPYPSLITVTGLDPALTYTISSVQLRNVSHTATGDIDALLVGPSGAQTLLMSDNFGDLILNNVNLKFSDSAPLTMGGSGDLSAQEKAAFEGSVFDVGGFDQPRANGGTATFRPSNIGSGDLFSPPAPVGPYTNSPLSTFTATGAALNGQTFRLFVQDDALLDSGLIAGGWEVSFSSTTVPDVESGRLLIPWVGYALLLVLERHRRQRRIGLR